jgi:hypothetical protein
MRFKSRVIYNNPGVRHGGPLPEPDGSHRPGRRGISGHVRFGSAHFGASGGYSAVVWFRLGYLLGFDRLLAKA